MQVSVIIVSYNTKSLLEQCLRSVLNQSLEIIVVDNASRDGSPEMVKTNFPQVKLIQNQGNLGFGAANNQAVKVAQGDYLLFLNPDTVASAPTINSLVKLAESNSASLASCRLNNPDGSLQPQGGSLPTLGNVAAWMLLIDDLPLINRFFPAYQRRTPAYFTRDQHPGWIAGTAMLIKKELFTILGGFNPAIFMYGEDVDLCYRASLKNYPCLYFHQPAITHSSHSSGSRLKAYEGEFKFIKYFFGSYKPTWQSLAVIRLLKIGCLLRTAIFGMIGDDDAKKTYQALYRLV